MQQNLFAWTEPTAPNPPYVSLNERGGKFFLAVRSPGAQNASEMELTPEQLRTLANALVQRFFVPGAA